MTNELTSAQQAKVTALISALDARYINESEYTTDMAGKADAEHTHTIGDITLDEGIVSLIDSSNSLNIDTTDIENARLTDAIAETSNNIDRLWLNKVDAEDGKGLSTEDFTSALKTKLEGIEAGANAYTHPTGIGSAQTSGLYKIATDAQGHITGATAVAKADITALGIPAQDTTYSEATTSTAGLMSASDKTALDNMSTAQAVTIDANANVTNGYLKTYEFKQGTTTIGKIDIPKDLVVTSGTLVTNPTINNETATGKYLQLTIANQTDPVYINVADLADVYTADNSTLQESSGQFSIKTGGVGTTQIADTSVTTAKLDTGVSTQWKADADTEIEAYLDALTATLNPSNSP